ncbi:tetratricopeptide repeat protein [Runella slithyformis]|uniref:Tetratricopeptide repeat protein n=1 Tax=Runella slithyformis (strain ATCC 29530 / DSM 19594 / LMG 11500 / NCIMB 11436 / LSU 4) TaxID=761193 RepID=A0A7U3ZKT2_RUNSL|nr:tetratricopeptide repeat protein [Runella slithyformis]AEI49052.1 hypothetical protein Runsl_2652 [Runella slithyformis DSM 19594]
MPRNKNKKHSPYYMGAMAKYCDLAIGGHPSARPSGVEQTAWFAKHLRKTGEVPADTTVSGVESMKKVYCKMRRSPWNCSFDEATLTKVCGMIGRDVEFADFSTYDDFKKWMGEPPQGDENWLATIARDRIQQLFEETQKQKLLIRNADLTALSLTFDIEKIEHYFLVGNLSAAETHKHAKTQRKHLEELEKLTEFAMQEIATESFLKAFNTVFVYDARKLSNAALTSKLWDIAWKIDRYLPETEKRGIDLLRHRLTLKYNLLKAAEVLGKNEMVQQLNRELAELIDEHSPFDVSALIAFHLGDYLISPHPYHSPPEYSPIPKELISPKSRPLFYYYLHGIIQFYQGRSFYPAAVQNLRRALEHLPQTEWDESLEAAHAYCLLSRIQYEMGHISESMALSEKATDILRQAVDRDILPFKQCELTNTVE